MSYYNAREDVSLTWSENRERLTLQGRQILRRVMNLALAEAAEQYAAALSRGEELRFGDNSDALKELLRQAAVKELGDGRNR